MNAEQAQEQLLDLLEDLSAIQGVRGALIATPEGAFASGVRSGLPPATANDIARTVRRMTVASATVGVPLQDLLINFGAARMMVAPITEEATIIVLLERDTALAPVRRLLHAQREHLERLIEIHTVGDADDSPGDEIEAEIDRIMGGSLGPILSEIRTQFTSYVLRAGRSHAEADAMMREQMREWLLCCNPSSYTFPLLIDGLSQLLVDAPAERSEFVATVQTTVRQAQTAEP